MEAGQAGWPFILTKTVSLIKIFLLKVVYRIKSGVYDYYFQYVEEPKNRT